MLSTYLVYVTEIINSFGVMSQQAQPVVLVLPGWHQLIFPWEVSFDVVK